MKKGQESGAERGEDMRQRVVGQIRTRAGRSQTYGMWSPARHTELNRRPATGLTSLTLSWVWWSIYTWWVIVGLVWSNSGTCLSLKPCGVDTLPKYNKLLMRITSFKPLWCGEFENSAQRQPACGCRGLWCPCTRPRWTAGWISVNLSFHHSCTVMRLEVSCNVLNASLSWYLMSTGN